MFSQAVYEAIRKRTHAFGVRMRGDNLKPIGFLGGKQNEPRIFDYQLDDSSTVRKLILHIQFPKFADANMLKDEDYEKREIRLPLNTDGGPSDGQDFSIQVNAQVFTGTVYYKGSHWAINYSVT